jgi:SAM-dependent methyltransferase
LATYDSVKINPVIIEDPFVYHRDGYDYALKYVKKFCKTSDRIMDIGCDRGIFLQMLSKEGFSDLTGMEMFEFNLELLSKLNISTIKSSVTDMASAYRESFYFITLFHVMEHIIDIDTAMNNIENYLLPNGILLIEVPDASRYAESSLSRFYREHINHFDKYSLVNLGKKYGFTAIDIVEGIGIDDDKCTFSIPSILMVFQFTNYTDTISPNRMCSESVKKHIALLKQSYASMDCCINDLIISQENVVIWGAGITLCEMLSLSDISKCNIDFIVDRDIHKQGKKINSFAIYDPSVLRKYTGSILVLNTVYQSNILKTISEMGLKNKVYICTGKGASQ